MLILLKHDDEIDSIDPKDIEARARAAFDLIQDTYGCQAGDSEAYVYRPDDTDSFAEEIEYADGSAEPDKIRDAASNWNRTIQDQFDQALIRAEGEVKIGPDHRRQWLGIPSSCIYDLKKAAMALDNSFYDFAEHALLVNGKNFFTTILSERELADVMAHPERYSLIDVTVK